MTGNGLSRLLLACAAVALVTGCESAADHAASAQAAQADTHLTLGAVQREIRVGMPSASVAELLGAPNMVTTDDERREVWVYDRISTTRAYSQSVAGVGVLFLGAIAGAGASSTSQRTLTVVVKFDSDGHVRDFAYRSSSF